VIPFVVRKLKKQKGRIAMQNVQPVRQIVFPRLLVEASIALLAGLVLSGAEIGSLPLPLPIAIAGCLSPLGAVAVLVGTLLRYLMSDLLMERLPLLLALLMVTCIRFFLRSHTSAVFLSLCSGICTLFCGLLFSFLQQKTGQDFLLYVMTACLTGTAAWFFHTVLTGMQKQQKIQLKSATGCAAAIVYILFISALTSFDYPFMNIGRILGIAVTLLAARRFRYMGGVICGALTVCGTMLCDGELGMPLLFLPITGLLAGYLVDHGIGLMTLLFFVLNALAQLTVSLQSITFSSVGDLFLGCIAFLLLNNICFDRWLITANSTYDTTMKTISTRLQFMAEAIHSVREDTSEIAALLQKQKPEPIKETVCAQVCADCQGQHTCWELQHTRTDDAFSDMVQQPVSTLPTLPESLTDCCQAERLQRQFYREKRRAQMETMQSSRMDASRNILFEQLQATEEVIASVGDRMTVRYSTELTDRICCFLERYGYDFDYVIAYYTERERLVVELYCKGRTLDCCMTAICHILSESLGISLQELEPVRTRSSVRYRMCQTMRYRLEQCTVSVAASADAEMSGDTAIRFQDGTGGTYIVLSDGMGTGTNAAIESKMTAEMFRKLICSGISNTAAIRLMNGLMVTKSAGEAFATLDAACVDLDDGTLTLLKSGAASTLIRQTNAILRICAPTFPIGSTAVSDCYEKQLRLSENDIFVMVSDGIPETEYPFIKELLLTTDDIHRMAEEICAKADIFSGGKHRDDVTVTVVKLMRNII
jgi:stage II sporulation protein E